MYKYFKNLSRHRWVTAECMPNLEKSANRSNLDGQSVRSTMRSHLIPYKRIYYYLYIIGIYGNEDPNNEIAWINTSNNITLPKRNTVWDVRVYNQTLIKVFVGRQKANRRLNIRVVKDTPSISRWKSRRIIPLDRVGG